MAAMRVILMLMAAFACRIASCIQQAPSNATTLQTSNSALASAEAQFARIATLPPPISVRTSQELRNALLQPGNLDIVLLGTLFCYLPLRNVILHFIFSYSLCVL